MPKDKACTECKRIVIGKACPACKTSKLTRNWQGSVFIMNTESEIAKAMGIEVPGKYAISVSK